MAERFLDRGANRRSVQDSYGEQLRLARRHPRGAFSFARFTFVNSFPANDLSHRMPERAARTTNLP